MVFSRIKWFVIAFVLISFVYFYRSISLEKSFQEIPKKISNFVALNANGEKSNYQNEKGKTTLIVLSASFCPGCLVEIPLLKKLHQKYENRGFKILMINEDENLKVMNRFIKEKKLPWTVLHWNYDVMNALGNPGVIPVSYLVNSNDSIVQINVGEFDLKDLEKEILHSLGLVKNR